MSTHHTAYISEQTDLQFSTKFWMGNKQARNILLHKTKASKKNHLAILYEPKTWLELEQELKNMVRFTNDNLTRYTYVVFLHQWAV